MTRGEDMDEIKKVLQYKEVGKMLGVERNVIYNRYVRGLMPPPDVYVNGTSPAWYEETIVKYKGNFKKWKRG